MAHNVVMNGKIVKKSLRTPNHRTEGSSFWFVSEKASTMGGIPKAPGMSLAKTDSNLRPLEDKVRGAAERAGHSSEALWRLRLVVKSQRQMLIDFAQQHRRHLTLIEFKEYKQLHAAWIEASRALWQFEHPGVPSPEFKLARV